ncbi:hypothetical protein ACFY3M_54195 [Streptomyces mirabilis]|uniref:hypothetical protein n=1 Tax=Streptomyces mirabilis TaxID=68239 RepID=UPI0036AB8514
MQPAGLQCRRPDRGCVCSTGELTCALERWIKFRNANVKPFKWTKGTGQIIDAIGRYGAKICRRAH